MFQWPSQPECPGLFIAGTDTGVGKTAVTCGIAGVLSSQKHGPEGRRTRFGLCKPFATGCRRCRAGWAGEDIEALAFAGGIAAGDAAAFGRLCPQAFELPASPAAAAVHERRAVDFDAVAEALVALDGRNDVVVVEGIGGPKVPLDPSQPRYCVAEFAADLGYPVVLVARAGLGTLSHTAMSVESLQNAGCRVVGVVVNDVDGTAGEDPTQASNPAWIERMTGIKVLARLQRCRGLAPGQPCPPAVLTELSRVQWAQLAAAPAKLTEPAIW